MSLPLVTIFPSNLLVTNLSISLSPNMSYVRICPLSLAHVGDKKVKRFHFSEIIGRLPYMRAIVTTQRAKSGCAEHHRAAVERMVNALPPSYLWPPRSGEVFDSLDTCSHRLRGFALAEGFDLVRKGGSTKANPGYRFRCVFHCSEIRNDRKLEDRVKKDSDGQIVSKPSKGGHLSMPTAV
jgi:hypothetical protein